MSYRPSLRFAGVCVVCALGSCTTDSLEPEGASIPQVPVAALSASGDTLTAVADALLKTQAKNSNTGTSTTIPVKITVGQDDTTRAIVKFHQAAIAAAVGSGTLTGASLELEVKESGTDAAGNDIDVHRVLKPWTENGVTWKCGEDLNTTNVGADCPTTKWKMSGAEMDAFVATRTARVHLTPGQTGVARFDVTSDLQTFLTGGSNHGWLVNAGSATSRALFWSREAALKPHLVLSITNEEAVPEQAPDTLPGWVYAPGNLDSNTASIGVAFVKNIVVVQFNIGATPAQRQAAVDSVGGTVVGGQRSDPGEGLYYLSIPDTGRGAALVAAAAKLEAMPQVALATYDFVMEPAYRRPDDGQDWNVWHLNRDILTGSNWGLEAVFAPMAWGCETGNADTRVAVVDGFGSLDPPADLSHLHVNRIAAIPQAAHPRHGISVSSVLGATGNNGMGMTGVMWEADIQGYEIGLPHTMLRIVARVKDAGRAGAPIINLSWQSGLGTNEHELERTRLALANALRDLRQGAPSRTPLLVLIAGNHNSPANVNGFARVKSGPDSTQVLVVAAMGPDSTLWDPTFQLGSNYGPLVDIAAPGESVGILDQYGNRLRSDGTSLAAPIVGGIAGLLRSFDQRLTAAGMRQLIKEAADSGAWSVVGADRSYPIANAHWALKLAAQRLGAPLCSNRVWAEAGGKIKAQRASAAELLFDAGDTAWAVTPMHGGKRISFTTAAGTFAREYDPSGPSWAPASLNAPGDHPSGVSRSLLGVSHDGDSTGTVAAPSPYIPPGTVGQVQVKVNGQTVATLPVRASPARPAGGPLCVGWTASGVCAGTLFWSALPEYQQYSLAYPPRGEQIYVAVNRNQYQAPHIADNTYSCSVPLGDSVATTCQNLKWDFKNNPGSLYAVNMRTGAVNTIAESTPTIYWMGLSESDSTMVLGEGQRSQYRFHLTNGTSTPSVFSSPDCKLVYRSLTYAGRDSLSTPDACHYSAFNANDRAGTGGMAASKLGQSNESSEREPGTIEEPRTVLVPTFPKREK